MNLTQFLKRWEIDENPFRGEEARHDDVFRRMGTSASTHTDFEKIVGDLGRPSSAIVFGEKGSGKTAIRLQIEERVREHNQRRPDQPILLLAYDDLNAVLDRFHERVGGKTPADSLKQLELVDHMDAMLGIVVPRLVDGLLGEAESTAIQIPAEARRNLRRLDRSVRVDLLLLQAAYDRTGEAGTRTTRLRRALGLPLGPARRLWELWVLLGIVPVLVLAAWGLWGWQFGEMGPFEWGAIGVVAALLLLAWGLAAGRELLRRMWLRRLAGRLRRRLRTSPREESSYLASLNALPSELRQADRLPVTDSDEPRYEMFDGLRRALRALGYVGLVIVVDRVDEPTLVNGDVDLMRAVVWPMLNNKFLQQDGAGVKMLLPMELRHLLFRESSAFFQGARLDKQHLVERLSWSGAMLFDLCEARLRACQREGAKEVSLMDLFDQDVSRQDVVDALDQMHQPRDAFKLMYHCLTEHCSNVTAGDGEQRVPRLVLELVRKQETERLQQLYRGIRPA